MATYQDLSDCTYFGKSLEPPLLAVGWLGKETAFSTGPTLPAVFEKLKQLLHDPWEQMSFGGLHDCEVCQFDASKGVSNLFVPNGTRIFVCPGLITHYIAAHYYQPPEEFVQAVIACPAMNSNEYKQLLLASGGGQLITRRS